MAVVLWGCPAKTDPEDTGVAVDVPPTVVNPLLQITTPSRGEFVPSQTVDITGSAVSGSAPLQQMTVNDDTTPLDGDGPFASELALKPGLNVLSFRLEDERGGRAVDGRSVYAGTLRNPQERIDNAVQLQLGNELLDDNDPDMDDLASVATLLLEQDSFSDVFVGVPLETSFATITPTSLTLSSADVDLWTTDGALNATVVLSDVEMDFDVDAGWFSTVGTAQVDALSIDLSIEADGSAISVSQSTATLDGFSIAVDWFPDFLEDELADWTVGTFEEQIADMAAETIATVVDEYLAAFSVETALLDGVMLSAEIADISASAAGLQLVMDASLVGDNSALPPNAGSVITDGSAPQWPSSDVPALWVALDDDLVNQLLFAIWSSGALSDHQYSGAELPVLAGSALAPPLGPVSSLKLTVGLPPSIHPPLDASMTLDVGLGEWAMTFEREDGVVFDFSVNVQTGATVDVNDSGELSLSIDNRPAYMSLAVGVVAHPDSLDSGDLAALVKLMVPPLFGNAGSFLPDVALPPIDLGAIDASLSGVVFQPQITSALFTDDRWLVLEGALSSAQ